MTLRLQLDRQPGAGVLWSGLTCKVCLCGSESVCVCSACLSVCLSVCQSLCVSVCMS